jgi:uncharacterized membrane-anchored protein
VTEVEFTASIEKEASGVLFVPTPIIVTPTPCAKPMLMFSERTLSVHSIRTTKRELFYWCAILFTFALGTSAGDLLAERRVWGTAPRCWSSPR